MYTCDASMLLMFTDNNEILRCVSLDIMKSKSNPDFMKKEQSKQSRGIRSKVSVKYIVFSFPNFRHLVTNSKIHME